MDFSIYFWICLAVGLLGGLTGVMLRIVPLWKIGKSDSPSEDVADEVLPPLSVIVYSHDSGDSLRTYLSELLRQDYPDFEVIVVLDSDDKNLGKTVARIEDNFPGVHATFIPQTTYHLSRRKLAFTLGVKAAKNPIVVTTSSNCRILSDRWLRSIASPFAEESASLVLGLCRLDFTLDRGAGKWYREFCDTLSVCLRLRFAEKGKAFRGDIFNMAFRRDSFFEINGFSSSNFLHTGDDDMFVAEMSARNEVVAVSNPDSRLLYTPDSSVKRYYTITKARYDFTSRYLPRSPFVLSGLASAAGWVAIIGFLGACLFAGLSPLGLAIPLFLLLIFWGLQIAAYRRAASALHDIRLWWAVVPFMLWLPIWNSLHRIRHRDLMRQTYTWRR